MPETDQKSEESLQPATGAESSPSPWKDDPSALLRQIRFNDDGLVPAIAVQFDSGDVLMMAWMNEDALRATLAEGRVCYWSRSRRALWRKGETSAQVQRLIELRLDCDGDTLLLLVDQAGVACHTGRRSCFYRAWRKDGLETILDVQASPEDLYGSGSD